MTSPDSWTSAEVAELMSLRAEGTSWERLARRFGRSYHATRNRWRRENTKRLLRGAPEQPDQFGYEFGEPWYLRGDWTVVGDVHVPFTDWDYAMLVAKIAKRYMRRPRRLLIAGDFFDMARFSRYEAVIEPPTWRQEQQAAYVLLKEWLETFDEIRMLMGNHDRRLQKFTAGAFDNTDLLNLIGINNPDRVRMSGWGWCVVDTPNGEWRITHPRNYSVNQLNVADTLAQKYQQHIISHHEHHSALGLDRFKRFILVNNGTLADPDKFSYAVLDDSTSAGMAQSFTLLRDGYPYAFGPWTDFGKWVE